MPSSEGHYYSDKAPGPSFLGIPVYAAVRPILPDWIRAKHHHPPGTNSRAFGDTLNDQGTGLRQDKIYQAMVLQIVTLVVVSLPAAFLGVLLFRFLNQIQSIHWLFNAAAALIFGLATPAFPYSATFISHQLVGFLLFGAFTIGLLMRQGRLRPAWAILAGFMLGFCGYFRVPGSVDRRWDWPVYSVHHSKPALAGWGGDRWRRSDCRHDVV